MLAEPERASYEKMSSLFDREQKSLTYRDIVDFVNYRERILATLKRDEGKAWRVGTQVSELVEWTPGMRCNEFFFERIFVPAV